MAALAMSVVVGDDYRDGADALAEVLRACGYCAAAAYTPADALAAPPADVVILELLLPGMTGWELARRLRDTAGPKRPFTIAVTTCAGARDSTHSAEAGIDLHLVKPVEPALLAGVLRRFSQALL